MGLKFGPKSRGCTALPRYVEGYCHMDGEEDPVTWPERSDSFRMRVGEMESRIVAVGTVGGA